MKFELEDNLRGATDEDLLGELRRCASHLGRETITIARFEQHGRCHPCTIQRRFGSWTNALARAGLHPSRSKIGISDEELFENLKALWISPGRQPRYGEARSPDSKYSAGTYKNRFGSWTKALQAFVDWVNLDDTAVPSSGGEHGDETNQPKVQTQVKPKRHTRREITDRQRFRILVREGFSCQSCGASPLKTRGVELHVDHIIPWDNGGETVDDNLQCKCMKCNLGKGKAFNGK
jgi:hypothetical protein